jgi:5-methylcytosine-specific restriction endonuclease McrA
MPMTKVCTGSPTCPHPAVHRGRCHLHAPVADKQFHPHDWVYRDKRWRQLSKQVRDAQPFCQLRLPGCSVVTEVADHVRPHRGDPLLAFAPSNVVAACRHCNSVKGQRLPLGGPNFDSPRRSSGSPCGPDARVAGESISEKEGL